MLVQGSVLEDRYRIERKTGEGGASTVYEAVQLRTGRRLAVKELTARSGEEASSEKLALLKRLRHPGLPMILDVLEEDGRAVLVMEYVEGITLQQEMDRRRREQQVFRLEEVLNLGEDLCRILEYLHTLPEPLLYGDLKPGNIMLRKNGQPVLVDLGTVGLLEEPDQTQTGSIGSPGYAAPEQFHKDLPRGEAADLYALGAVLHQLITGIDPAEKLFYFEKITKAVPDWEHRYRGSRREFLGLERILERCTRFRSGERYQSAEELLADLQTPLCLLPESRGDRICHSLSLIFIFFGIFFGILAARSDYLTDVIRQEGKEFCLMKARRTEPEQCDAWIQEALEFCPGDSACFSVLLDRLLADGYFAGEEQLRIRSLLDQHAEGEAQDHEALMHRDVYGFFRFAYRIGTAYLYASDGLPDYTAAEEWLQEALKTGGEWIPAADKEEEEKQLLLRRTEILKIICSYRGEVLTEGYRTDAPASLRIYWNSLSELLEEDFPTGNLLVTELGLWREVLGLLADWPSELKEAGVDWIQQEKAAEAVERLADVLLGGEEAKESPVVKKQLTRLKTTAAAVREKRLLLEEAEEKERRKQNGGT